MPVVAMLPEHREEINRAIVPGFGDRPEARRLNQCLKPSRSELKGWDEWSMQSEPRPRLGEGRIVRLLLRFRLCRVRRVDNPRGRSEC
jgi:hypothetical protein